MNLFDIQDYIVSQVTDLQISVDLFVFHMPETVKSGVLLALDTAGARSDDTIPGLYHNRFQTIIREVNYAEGYAMAKNISNVLDVRGLTLGSIRYDFIKPNHNPIPYRRGQSDLLEFSVNYKVRYIET